jgi:hypothetical protein
MQGRRNTLHPGTEPSREEPVRRGRRRQRDHHAIPQLVADVGAVLPAEELRQGHPFDRKFAHARPPDSNLALAAIIVICPAIASADHLNGDDPVGTAAVLGRSAAR